MIRTALPQLRHTPVGKRLETKINEIDGHTDDTQTEVDGYTPFSNPSASTSPSASDVLSGEETSMTEDTGVTSSDADLYSPENKPKSEFEGNEKSNPKSKQGQSMVRENEELESLLQ